MCLGLYLVFKFKKSPTYEKFFSQVFIFSKLAIGVIAYYSVTYVALIYLSVFFGLLFVSQPEYSGPTQVTEVAPNSLTYQLKKDTTEDVYRVVFFYTTWADTCAQLSSTYARLSLTYAAEGLKFSKVYIPTQFPLSLSPNSLLHTHTHTHHARYHNAIISHFILIYTFIFVFCSHVLISRWIWVIRLG